MKKKLLWILICFFVGMGSTSAKEFDFYFYPNGGKVTTNNFELGDYGYLSYNGNYYASYNEKSTIKKINSIKGIPFQLEKSGTTLVKGREWYTIVDGKTYFFDDSKSYSMKTVLKTIKLENEDFYSFDLYANWNDKKRTSGIDIASGKETSSNSNSKKKKTSNTKKATSIEVTSSKNNIEIGDSVTLTVSFKPSGASKETITWTSSNTKIATISSSGKVTGVSAGTVTITAKSKNGLKSTKTITISKKQEAHKVTIRFHINGGKLSPTHSSAISIKDNYVYKNNKLLEMKYSYNEKISNTGLIDYNNADYINILKSGYSAVYKSEWNTKADGTGKSFNQYTVYKASDFCDASKKDCTVTLYLNWKKVTFKRVPYLTVPESIKTNYGYNSVQSIVYTGKYFVFVLLDSKNNNNALYIMKQDSSGKWVYHNFIKNLSIGHGQDVTYIPKKNEIAFLEANKVMLMDANTFKFKQTITLSHMYTCLAYDRVNDRFILGYGANDGKIYYTVCNSTLSNSSCKMKKFTMKKNMTGQSCESHNGYFYRITFDAGFKNKYLSRTVLGQSGGEIVIFDSNYKVHNYIRFTADNGVINGTTMGEIEGIDFVNGKPYVSFTGPRDEGTLRTIGRVYTVSY